MKILALDMAAATGYALNLGGAVRFGSVQFRGERPERLASFATWLEVELAEQGYDAVVYERPFARGLAATRSGWGFAGVCEAVAWRSGCAVIDVNVQTVKKHVGITGKAKPLDWARERGFKVNNDHEADALVLLHYTLENAEIING